MISARYPGARSDMFRVQACVAVGPDLGPPSICCSFGCSPSGEGRRSDLVRSSSYGGALLKCESVNLTLQVQHKETVSPNRVSLCLRVCFGSCFSVLTQTLESVVCMCKRGG